MPQHLHTHSQPGYVTFTSLEDVADALAAGKISSGTAVALNAALTRPPPRAFLAVGSEQDLDNPAGAERCWPDAAARAAALFPGVPLVVDPAMQAAPDGSTVHLPARSPRPLSDDEPLTPNPLDRYTNR